MYSMVDYDEPTTYLEEISDHESTNWKEVMESKINFMYDNQV